MSSTPFMQLYVADYLGDTQHLTTEQHGAYLLILMTMWRNGGVIPNDKSKLARIARVSPKRWHLISDEIMEFFDIEGENITQKRLVEEFQKAVSKSEKRSASGKLGGLAKSLKNNDAPLANAKQMPQHLSESDTRYNKSNTSVLPKKTKKACRLPEDFKPDFSIAYDEGFSQEEAQRLFASFKDYWDAKPGKDGTKLDWQATWRNWVRSDYNQKFKGNRNAGNRNNQQPFGNQVSDAIRQLGAARDAKRNERQGFTDFSSCFETRPRIDASRENENSEYNQRGQTIDLLPCK